MASYTDLSVISLQLDGQNSEQWIKSRNSIVLYTVIIYACECRMLILRFEDFALTETSYLITILGLS